MPLEPEAVFRVHQAYIEAGAQIIETNTFGANRFKLEPLGLGDEVQKLNSRGVKIAREARESASREVLIAGSIGPLGIGVQARHPEPDEILNIFHEQALALEERGVDLFILETFTYIEELLLAIDAIRSFSGLPIICAAHLFRRGNGLRRFAPRRRRRTTRRTKTSRSSARTARSARNRCFRFLAHSPAWTMFASAACPTRVSPSAKATASFIRNLRRNISRSSRAKRPRSACAFSAAAAALRPRTFARWPTP